VLRCLGAGCPRFTDGTPCARLLASGEAPRGTSGLATWQRASREGACNYCRPSCLQGLHILQPDARRGKFDHAKHRGRIRPLSTQGICTISFNRQRFGIRAGRSSAGWRVTPVLVHRRRRRIDSLVQPDDIGIDSVDTLPEDSPGHLSAFNPNPSSRTSERTEHLKHLKHLKHPSTQAPKHLRAEAPRRR
jgi:hypothetical protein